MTTSDDGEAGRPPLSGIRVLEIAQNFAVPYCGRLLAGMGADVVKVEPPFGDMMRHSSPLPALDTEHPEGKPFAATNHGKRSVVIDLVHHDAAPVRDALVRWADIVLVAVKPPDIARYQLHYDQLSAVNPSVIVLDHRPFGPEGPYGDQGGYDVLMQGLSGMAMTTGRPVPSRQFPASVRPVFNDWGTGMLSAAGLLAALRHRDLTGVGQRVETSLLATSLAFMGPLVSQFEDSQTAQVEWWEETSSRLPPDADFETWRAAYERPSTDQSALRLYFRHYRTADSFLSVGAFSRALRLRFHHATGVPDPLATGTQPKTPEWDAVISEAETVLASRTTAEWLAIMAEHGVPAARFNLPHEALDEEQVTANAFQSELEHPVFGRYTTPSMPIRWSATPAVADSASPVLDADTDHVLIEVGLPADQVAALRRHGVIGVPAPDPTHQENP